MISIPSLNIAANIVDMVQAPIYKKNGAVSLVLKTFTISLVNAVLINQAKITTNKNTSSILTVTSLIEVPPKINSGERSMEIIMMIKPISGLIRVGIKTRKKIRMPILRKSKVELIAKKVMINPQSKTPT